MPATIIPFTAATPLLETAQRRGSALTTQPTKKTRVKSIDEPETRLWKVCAQRDSRGEGIIEWTIFAVFILIAMAVPACFVEVEQRTDAIRQAAARPFITVQSVKPSDGLSTMKPQANPR